VGTRPCNRLRRTRSSGCGVLYLLWPTGRAGGGAEETVLWRRETGCGKDALATASHLVHLQSPVLDCEPTHSPYQSPAGARSHSAGWSVVSVHSSPLSLSLSMGGGWWQAEGCAGEGCSGLQREWEVQQVGASWEGAAGCGASWEECSRLRRELGEAAG
jgi:hypothetical protein